MNQPPKHRAVTLLNYSTRMQVYVVPHHFHWNKPAAFSTLSGCVRVCVSELAKIDALLLSILHFVIVFLCNCHRYCVCILHFVFLHFDLAYLHHVSFRIFVYRQVSISQMQSFIAGDCSYSSIACLFSSKINGHRFFWPHLPLLWKAHPCGIEGS